MSKTLHRSLTRSFAAGLTALTLASVAASGAAVLTTPAASAGVLMNVRAEPSTSATIVGMIDADCSLTQSHYPGTGIYRDTPEGRWWLTSFNPAYGDGWVLATGDWCI